MTLIWLACVTAAWTPSDPPAVGYHVEVAGTVVADVNTNQYVVCVPEKYEELSLRVQGFNAAGAVSKWSEPLMLARVHHFDADGDGRAGWPDWGRFVQAFGCVYRADGAVGECQ